MRIIRMDNQHSPTSGDCMDPHPAAGDIRTARCTIRSPAAFLRDLRAVAADYDTHIICFNADMIAGRVHAASAVDRAVRAFGGGERSLILLKWSLSCLRPAPVSAISRLLLGYTTARTGCISAVSLRELRSGLHLNRCSKLLRKTGIPSMPRSVVS